MRNTIGSGTAAQVGGVRMRWEASGEGPPAVFVHGIPIGEHLPFYLESGGAASLVRQARSLDVRDILAVADKIPDLDLPARVVWGAADGFQPIGYGYRPG